MTSLPFFCIFCTDFCTISAPARICETILFLFLHSLIYKAIHLRYTEIIIFLQIPSKGAFPFHMNLTFGEQIKILLSREGRTIKDFAEQVEAFTGIPCSRQNLTQKLKRDNFQEQDMRTLAAILGYQVEIRLIPAPQTMPQAEPATAFASSSYQPTIPNPAVFTPPCPETATESDTAQILSEASEPYTQDFSDRELLPDDCINPQTGEEYQTNTVRPHPSLAHFIQVYDQNEHTWTDISEDYFLKFQDQKRKILGRDYSPPVYL